MKFWNKMLFGAVLGLGLAGTMMAQEIILKSDFNNTADPLPNWSSDPAASIVKEGPNGTYCLKFNLPIGGTTRQVLLYNTLPLNQLKGKNIIVEAEMKGQNLSKPKADYLGPKLMLMIKSPKGDQWPDQEKKTGNFDWQKFSFKCQVPEDATEVTLIVGMQDCQGTLWVNNLKITTVP